MAEHIEVIKTLTIPDYRVEMCIVSVISAALESVFGSDDQCIKH